MLRRVIGQGLVAGLTGTALMTAAEKVEQRFSGRPDSDVPAGVPARLTGLPEHRRGSRALPGRHRDVAPPPR